MLVCSLNGAHIISLNTLMSWTCLEKLSLQSRKTPKCFVWSSRDIVSIKFPFWVWIYHWSDCRRNEIGVATSSLIISLIIYCLLMLNILQMPLRGVSSLLPCKICLVLLIFGNITAIFTQTVVPGVSKYFVYRSHPSQDNVVFTLRINSFRNPQVLSWVCCGGVGAFPIHAHYPQFLVWMIWYWWRPEIF